MRQPWSGYVIIVFFLIEPLDALRERARAAVEKVLAASLAGRWGCPLP
jgi:hypothetical protein